MSAEDALAVAMKLADDDDLLLGNVIAIRYISLEQRLLYEPAQGGEWAIWLEEKSPYGEQYGTEECLVMVDDLTGQAKFEMTL